MKRWEGAGISISIPKDVRNELKIKLIFLNIKNIKH